MPKNASYMYDIITSGAEIEYGYAIIASINEKIVYEDLVRGKAGGLHKKCQNARIQNVFGGISPAEFIANDDMNNRCNGTKDINIDNLREEVFSKISDSLLKVPTVSVAHEMN